MKTKIKLIAYLVALLLTACSTTNFLNAPVYKPVDRESAEAVDLWKTDANYPLTGVTYLNGEVELTLGNNYVLLPAQMLHEHNRETFGLIINLTVSNNSDYMMSIPVEDIVLNDNDGNIWTIVSYKSAGTIFSNAADSRKTLVIINPEGGLTSMGSKPITKDNLPVIEIKSMEKFNCDLIFTSLYADKVDFAESIKISIPVSIGKFNFNNSFNFDKIEWGQQE